MKNLKRHMEFLLSVVFPALALITVITEHCGVFDRLFGLNQVRAVADRFQRSYGSDASVPLYRGDPAWAPTLALIERYSAVRLQPNKQPEMIVRYQASLATEDAGGYQWTSPSTPILVLYRRWPVAPNITIPKRDATIVGTIGQLHMWIARREVDLHFLINDVILGGITVVLGYWVWHANERRNPRGGG